MRQPNSWELDEALDNLDELLQFYGVDLVELAKARENPLTRSGFDKWVTELFRRLGRTVREAERRATRTMLRALNRNWAGMTEAQAIAAITRATVAVGNLGSRLAIPVAEECLRAFRDITTASNVGAAAQYSQVGIISSTDLVDNRVVSSIRERQAFFVRNEYGVRQAALSARARAIVAAGTEAGFTSAAISERLARELGAMGIRRSRSYYQTCAAIYQARGRSYGLLRSFDDAGIQRFRFEAVLDRQTTEQCRFLHGQVFSVPSALGSFDAVADAGPESVYDLQPFVNVGPGPNGERELWYRQGREGERVRVAQIDRPGVGKPDTRGSYSRAMSTGALESAGITTPPLHGRCRSTLIAEV